MLEQLNGHSRPSSFTLETNGRHSFTRGDFDHSVRVILMMATPLDSQLLAAQFGNHRGLEVVEYTAELGFGVARCRALRPQVLVVDPRLRWDAVEQACALLSEQCVEHVIVLDDYVCEGRLAKLLAISGVSYITRQAGLDALR